MQPANFLYSLFAAYCRDWKATSVRLFLYGLKLQTLSLRPMLAVFNPLFLKARVTLSVIGMSIFDLKGQINKRLQTQEPKFPVMAASCAFGLLLRLCDA